MRQKIVVELEQAIDRMGLLDVIKITEGEKSLDECKVVGLIGCSRLIVGSWIRKPELDHKNGIKSKNPHLKFILRQIGKI